MKKQGNQIMKQVCGSIFEMVAKHMVLTIGAISAIVCLAILYYVCQQGVFDDIEDPVVEIPFEG